jgi:hypothetical protein
MFSAYFAPAGPGQQAQLFKDFYFRNNKGKRQGGQKNLRCFPCCGGRNGEHCNVGFCGIPIRVQCEHTLDSRSPLCCFGRFKSSTDSDDAIGINEGDIIPLDQILDEARTGDSPLAPWWPGMAVLDGKLNTSGADAFEFNSEKKGWHHGFNSNRFSDEHHTFLVFFFQETAEGQYKCVGSVQSDTFKVYSQRRATKKKKAAQKEGGVERKINTGEAEPAKMSKRARGKKRQRPAPNLAPPLPIDRGSAWGEKVNSATAAFPSAPGTLLDAPNDQDEVGMLMNRLEDMTVNHRQMEKFSDIFSEYEAHFSANGATACIGNSIGSEECQDLDSMDSSGSDFLNSAASILFNLQIQRGGCSKDALWESFREDFDQFKQDNAAMISIIGAQGREFSQESQEHEEEIAQAFEQLASKFQQRTTEQLNVLRERLGQGGSRGDGHGSTSESGSESSGRRVRGHYSLDTNEGARSPKPRRPAAESVGPAHSSDAWKAGELLLPLFTTLETFSTPYCLNAGDCDKRLGHAALTHAEVESAEHVDASGAANSFRLRQQQERQQQALLPKQLQQHQQNRHTQGWSVSGRWTAVDASEQPVANAWERMDQAFRDTGHGWLARRILMHVYSGFTLDLLPSYFEAQPRPFVSMFNTSLSTIGFARNPDRCEESRAHQAKLGLEYPPQLDKHHVCWCSYWWRPQPAVCTVSACEREIHLEWTHRTRVVGPAAGMEAPAPGVISYVQHLCSQARSEAPNAEFAFRRSYTLKLVDDSTLDLVWHVHRPPQEQEGSRWGECIGSTTLRYRRVEGA